MSREVEIQFPKITLEKSLSLRDVFNEMEAGVFFDRDADFSTLTNYTNGVFFRDAEHKAKLSIDEEGNLIIYNEDI